MLVTWTDWCVRRHKLKLDWERSVLCTETCVIQVPLVFQCLPIIFLSLNMHIGQTSSPTIQWKRIRGAQFTPNTISQYDCTSWEDYLKRSHLSVGNRGVTWHFGILGWAQHKLLEQGLLQRQWWQCGIPGGCYSGIPSELAPGAGALLTPPSKLCYWSGVDPEGVQ